MLRWGAALVGVGLLLMFCLGMVVVERTSDNLLRTYRGLTATIPEGAYPSTTGERYINLPTDHTASHYRSPVDGDLISEWPGGTAVMALGSRFFDGFTDWEMVRDPSGNEVWVIALFLDERYTASDPPVLPADAEYLGPVWWEGEIAYCTNPAGGPPGLDGDAFVALVERAAARWQEVDRWRPAAGVPRALRQQPGHPRRRHHHRRVGRRPGIGHRGANVAERLERRGDRDGRPHQPGLLRAAPGARSDEAPPAVRLLDDGPRARAPDRAGSPARAGSAIQHAGLRSLTLRAGPADGV